MIVNVLCQIALTVLSGLAIGLLALGGKWARWGFVFGLASEVFWIRLAVIYWQVDVFLLTIWWAVCYALGCWRSFRGRKKL